MMKHLPSASLSLSLLSLQGDSIDDIGMILPPAESSSHVKVRRRHQYEEVKPKILYADLDMDLGQQAKSRTIK